MTASSKRLLIINADGYGFTAGITRAIDECITFGTVRSISVNVNFEHARALERLVGNHPELSVGCHVNPVVGRPVLPPEQVPSLVDESGCFFYTRFVRRFLAGEIRTSQLKAEMLAQIRRTRDLAGGTLSHVDFHMGLHRLPRLYDVFLDVVAECGIRRIRTHRYLVGLEGRSPRLRHLLHVLSRPSRAAKYGWNLSLRRRAVSRGLAMPDWRVEITEMTTHPDRIRVACYLAMLRNLPDGVCEFVAHPAYVDEDLNTWSTYRHQRELEREVLLSVEFREGLERSGVRLAGYRDIPV